MHINQCLPGSKVLSHGDSDIVTVLHLQPTHLQINEGYKKVCIYTNIKKYIFYVGKTFQIYDCEQSLTA